MPGINLPTAFAKGNNDSRITNDNKSYLPLVMTNGPQLPRVNIPFFDNNVIFEQTGIFWFGKVSYIDNYTEVRVGYNKSELWVFLTIKDDLLWYNPTPSVNDITLWDSASIYLNVNPNSNNHINSQTYRFDGELNWWEPRGQFQASYSGNIAGWEEKSIPFTTQSGYRGNQPNDTILDSGWTIQYQIPFTSLGFSEPPSDGSNWGLSVIVHDRDSQNGPPNPDKKWPSQTDPVNPDTWGQMHFGLPIYTPPAGVTPSETVKIRNGVNGITVTDGMVGGGTMCGEGLTDYLKDWGQLNYQGAEQVNVQNEWDVSDWPCFSKFYITFPLDSLPSGKKILSATLTLYSIGNAGGGQWGSSPNSLVQIFTVNQDWTAATINWNNAPQAQENVSRAWVEPITDGIPGVPRTWDLSYAVNQAYQSKIPLRLALYSADYLYHTGRYFEASGGYSAWRPELDIVLGNP